MVGGGRWQVKRIYRREMKEALTEEGGGREDMGDERDLERYVVIGPLIGGDGW